MSKLADKTALVTGGATGIGHATAQALASEGCRVAIASRSAEKLDAAARNWHAATPLLTHPVDVGDRRSVADLFRWADEQLGYVDILVNAAGINFRERSMADISAEQWDQVLHINATGTFNCIRAVLPSMRERRDGLIVIINSIAGMRSTMVGGVAYSAAKFAANALGTAVSLEDGKHGIRVTNIFPGEVNTQLIELRATPVPPEQRLLILQPDDVAAAVLFVACLPPRAHVPRLVIKPTFRDFT